MRAHLLNSAMMPAAGVYRLVKINAKTFANYLQDYYEKNQLINYIGYEATTKHIKDITNIRIPVNRVQVNELHDGDVLLICKLKYRLENPSNKGNKEFQKNLTCDDFEYYIAFYSER